VVCPKAKTAPKSLTRITAQWSSVWRIMKRKILVILSNRLNRMQKPKWLELDSDEKGNIHQQRPLRSPPREARFDEVWENDEGKTEFASCFRFKRRYGHKLQKKAK
jgi:hypothetical protein